MKEASLEITLELEVTCPYCHYTNDLRENDHEIDCFWSQKATERLNRYCDISETHECYNCGKSMRVTKYEML